MFKRNLRPIYVSIEIIIIFLVIIFPFQFFLTRANVNSEIPFGTTDKFEITQKNSSISFGFEGIYTKAYLEDDMWNFENLRSINSDNKYNLKVSATNCNINITFYRIYNRIYLEENTTRAILAYVVDGPGTQAFVLELNPNEGDYGVVIDGIFESLNHGWKLSPEGNPIITGAREHARVSYYGYLPSYINRKGSINEHSVFIASTFFALMIITFASVIATRKKNKKPDLKIGANDNGLGK